jgi:hypothetical protein
MHDFCVRKASISRRIRSRKKIEAEYKKASARESGAQGVLFDEKTKGKKFRDTVLLTINAAQKKIAAISIPAFED